MKLSESILDMAVEALAIDHVRVWPELGDIANKVAKLEATLADARGEVERLKALLRSYIKQVHALEAEGEGDSNDLE